MAKYVMKQFDLEPAFEAQLLDGTTPVDLTSAVAVLFLMKSRKKLTVTGSMSIADQSIPANTGIVRYDWADGDTATTGTYNAEIQVTWPPDRPQTFPANQYLTVEIQKDLGPAPAFTTTIALSDGGHMFAFATTTSQAAFTLTGGGHTLALATTSRQATFTLPGGGDITNVVGIAA